LIFAAVTLLNRPVLAQQASQQDYADCQQMGDLERGIAACNRIVNDRTQSDADRAVAYGWLGNDHIAKNALDDAIRDLSEAIRINPQNASLYASRAIANSRKGDRAAAIGDYRKAKAIDPAKIEDMLSANAELKEIANAAASAPKSSATAAPSPIPTRMALVIGNANYADGPLKEPVKDARDIADELKRDGFTVEIGENLTGESMRKALERLYGHIKPGSVALIFFSGYGVQSNRQSYMIPTDAQIWTEPDVRRDGFSLETMLNEVNDRGAGIKIALIDASSRNPYERRFRGFSAGLAPVIAPNGTLVMYSAAISSVISDDGGDHSLFVQELLKQIRVPGLMAEETLNRTRVGITRASRSAQVPWISSSLATDFSFMQP